MYLFFPTSSLFSSNSAASALRFLGHKEPLRPVCQGSECLGLLSYFMRSLPRPLYGASIYGTSRSVFPGPYATIQTGLASPRSFRRRPMLEARRKSRPGVYLFLGAEAKVARGLGHDSSPGSPDTVAPMRVPEDD